MIKYYKGSGGAVTYVVSVGRLESGTHFETGAGSALAGK